MSSKKEPLGGVRVIMAADPEEVVARFREVNTWGLPRVEHMEEMREGIPIAIVGGGPSLNETFRGIEPFRKVMVCGSAHDHAIRLGIKPTWVVVCDPDPIMALYLKEPSPGTKYLVASACAQEVFDVLSGRDIAIWNCSDELIDSAKWEDQGLLFGGGCTVLSRAIWIAGVFGYWNMHFFGCDNSIRADAHHAYDFKTPGEETGEIVPIQITLDGPEYLVPNYLVGQIFDLRTIIFSNQHRIQVTVHGDGLFAAMMAEANRRRKDAQES
jgi:Protein of unknown function DUF115